MNGKLRIYPRIKMIPNLSAKNIGCLASRIIVSAVFICAGMLKLYSPTHFAEDIAAYRILPSFLVTPMALDLPVMEIICGLMILTGVYARIATLAVIILLTGFCGAIVHSLLRGLPISCGCFGESWFDARPGYVLVRDIFLICLALIIYRTYLTKTVADASSH